MTANLLIIEDDPTVNELVSQNLRGYGYSVDTNFDGQNGIQSALTKDYDLILLDLMIPHIDGLQLLQQLRHNKQTPVLILSAKGGEEDRIFGFKTGADDYLTKPFSMEELRLRVEAILRRAKPTTPNSPRLLTAGEISLDVVKGAATASHTDLTLTPLEFDILKAFVVGAGTVLSKPFFYQSVLCREYSRYDRTLDMHVSKIRKKLSHAGLSANAIKTVRGHGYLLDV